LCGFSEFVTGKVYRMVWPVEEIEEIVLGQRFDDQ
jgi:hypothetical protein